MGKIMVDIKRTTWYSRCMEHHERGEKPRRIRRLGLRLTDEELRRIQEQATAHYISLSGWIRQRLFRVEP